MTFLELQALQLLTSSGGNTSSAWTSSTQKSEGATGCVWNHDDVKVPETGIRYVNQAMPSPFVSYKAPSPPTPKSRMCTGFSCLLEVCTRPYSYITFRAPPGGTCSKTLLAQWSSPL